MINVKKYLDLAIAGISAVIAFRLLRTHQAPWDMIAVYWVVVSIRNILKVR